MFDVIRRTGSLVMAKSDALTLQEFKKIEMNLSLISPTWSDLWMLLFYLKIGVGELLSLKYSDVSGEYLVVDKVNGRKILLNGNVRSIIYLRRLLNPNDVYIFQSRSNRVKFASKPVSVIAFNTAIKAASKGVTDKNVSSRSAAKTRAALKLSPFE